MTPTRLGASIFTALLCTASAMAQTMVLAPTTVNAAQEVPTNGSTATGTAQLVFNATTNVLSWHIAYSGVTATASHFHGPAGPGINAGVQVNVGTANPAIGSATLSAAQAADLLSGKWYYNVHSTAFPAGEIRGDISGASITVVLNEVFYDGVGADEGQTFVEIFGPAGMDLTGWRVVGLEGSGGSCGTVNGSNNITLAGAIASDGLFVLADDNGAGVTAVTVPATHNGGVIDQLNANVDFENGNADAVQLVHPSGTVVDAMTYGDLATCTVDAGGQPIVEGAPAFDTFGGSSLSRWPAGNDTDNNKIDFTPDCDPSAGASPSEPRALFFTGNTSISGAAGGAVGLTIHTGRTTMQQYIVLAFLTQPTSKTTLALPFDPLTTLFINLATAGSPLFVGFVGNLDACGEATATLTVPAGTPIPSPGLGVNFVGAVLPFNPSSIATNSVLVNLLP